jgi:CBS domain-containing protein
MQARDLIGAVPAVTPDDSLLQVIASLVAAGTSGVAVVDEQGRPRAVLPGSALVGLAVPSYVKDDPSLAAVLADADPAILRSRIARLTVADVLADPEPDALPLVRDAASLLEVATVMADERVGIVLVVDADGRYVGAVAATDLLATFRQ